MAVRTKRLALGALFTALGILLPLAFHLTGIPAAGQVFLPMHIPVLLCGFVCGWPYGLAVGFVSPLLRFLLFSMPPIFPEGLSMAFELAAYGLCAGLFYRLFPKKIPYIYLNLILSMLLGRAVWGLVRWILSGVAGTGFTFAMFLAGGFTNAVPGILCQLLLIPLVVIALRRSRLMLND